MKRREALGSLFKIAGGLSLAQLIGCKDVSGPSTGIKNVTIKLTYSRLVAGGTSPDSVEHVGIALYEAYDTTTRSNYPVSAISQDVYEINLSIKTQTKYRGFVQDPKMYLHCSSPIEAGDIALNVLINNTKMICIPVCDCVDSWIGDFSFEIGNDGTIKVYSS
jgi:hypothetical protein